MKPIHRTFLALATLALLSTPGSKLSTAFAQGTAFTYQGRLTSGTNTANGSYDLTFSVWTNSSGPAQTGGTLTNPAVAVSNGLFTVALDFGASAFTGANRWLEIGVRTNGGGAFTTLSPRQKITPAPYAITAGNVVSGGLAAGAYGNAITFSNAGNSFSGSGTGLTGLNASQLISGAVPSGALGNAWKISGNAGTTPGTHFLGTTDNSSLEMRVANERAMRFIPGTGYDGSVGPTIVGGSYVNFISGSMGAAVIGGGWDHFIDSGATATVIAGGHSNRIGNNAKYSVISGGRQNEMGLGASHSVIAGGQANQIGEGNIFSAISGGSENRILGTFGNVHIGGGLRNSVTGQVHTATISGGRDNLIGGNGYGAAIPGGANNYVSGLYALAAGFGARAEHDGAFVWADAQGGSFASTSSNQFLIRAAGGVGVGVNAPQQQLSISAGMNIDQNNANAGSVVNTLRFGSASGEAIGSKRTAGGNQYGLDFYTSFTNRLSIANSGSVLIVPPASLFLGNQTRQMINLWGTEYGIGVQDFTMYFRTDGFGPGGGFAWHKGGAHSDSQNDSGGGVTLMRLDTSGNLYTMGAVNPPSDRNAKQNFRPVDGREVLAKVVALPITRWSYKSGSGEDHLGPVAQDFHAAFGLGTDDKHIATVDADGVVLAAIQGLNQKLTEELKRRDAENAELKQRMEKLERLLEQRLNAASAQ